MASWKWVTTPVAYKDTCSVCSKPLRGSGGEIVEWTDSQRYHVGCLLDKLAEPAPSMHYPYMACGAD